MDNRIVRDPPLRTAEEIAPDRQFVTFLVTVLEYKDVYVMELEAKIREAVDGVVTSVAEIHLEGRADEIPGQ